MTLKGGFPYYLMMECDECDTEMYYGVCVTFLEHKNLPVITLSSVEAMVLTCPKCNTEHYIGDLDIYTEVPEQSDDEDEDEDEDEDDTDEDDKDD